MSFSKQLNKFSLKARENNRQLVRGVKLGLFKAVVNDTPVDTGRLRGNWQASIGSPKSGELEARGLPAVFGEIEANLGKIGEASVLTNNLPYAQVVEYGGFPNPPEYKATKGDGQVQEVKVIGGYSKKAPEGMVRRNVSRFRKLVQKELRKLNK